MKCPALSDRDILDLVDCCDANLLRLTSVAHPDGTTGAGRAAVKRIGRLRNRLLSMDGSVAIDDVDEAAPVVCPSCGSTAVENATVYRRGQVCTVAHSFVCSSCDVRFGDRKLPAFLPVPA